KLVEKPPATGDWIYELKFDGIRLIAVRADKKVSLLSRNQNDLSARFPEIVEAIKNLAARECVIDGEVVALDDEGRSSFQLLQALEMEGRKSPVYFYAFALLKLAGKGLIALHWKRERTCSKSSRAMPMIRSATPEQLVVTPNRFSMK